MVRNGTTTRAQIFLFYPVYISSKQANINNPIRSIQFNMISNVFTNDDYSIQPLISFQLMSVGSGACLIDISSSPNFILPSVLKSKCNNNFSHL